MRSRSSSSRPSTGRNSNIASDAISKREPIAIFSDIGCDLIARKPAAIQSEMRSLRLDRNVGKGSRTVDLFRRGLVAGYFDVVVDEVDGIFHAIGLNLTEDILLHVWGDCVMH